MGATASSACDALADLVNDDDESVRVAAAEALRRIAES
jgi:HEAT repeat protein